MDNQKLNDAINKLTKWRSLFSGWQLGQTSEHHPEVQAVRDHREVTILLRAEANAIVQTMDQMLPGFLKKFQENLLQEVEALDSDYEKRFPGVKSTKDGLSFDISIINDSGWMKDWKR